MPRNEKAMKLNKILLTIHFLFALLILTATNSSNAYPTSKVSSFSSTGTSTYYDAIEKPNLEQKQSVKMSRSSREISTSRASIPLSPGSHNLSIGVGQIFLTGDLSDNAENAIGTQVQYTYGVSDLFSFESNFGYSSHSAGNVTLVHLISSLRTNLVYFDQLVPFLSAGLGFYNPSVKLSPTNEVSALLFGLNLGAGAELLLSDRVFFGTRLTYHNMFDSSKRSSEGALVNVGGAFLSFMVQAGLSF